MKTFFVLGGYGEMGRIASLDLSKSSKGVVVVAGRDEKKAQQYARSLGKNCIGAYSDATKPKELARILKKNKVGVVVNCSHYYYNMDVMKACLSAGCHYLDLGGLYHMTLKQLKLHNRFKKKRLTAILGCGSTPGITNVMAGYAAKMLDSVDTIRVRFAGYSFGQQKTHFVVPYSMYTVFDEFTAKPAVFEDGKIKFVEPMSGKAKETFPPPIGEITSFYTLHSEIATFPSSFKNKGIMNCDFKVAFDEDFVHDVSLLVEAGLASKNYVNIGGAKVRPIDLTVKELNRFIPDNSKVDDIEYVRVVLSGRRGKKNREITVDCLSKSSKKWKASAGDIDTGVPPSVIAQFIANRKVKEKGVLAPENCVPAALFFRELAKRGMTVITTIKAL